MKLHDFLEEEIRNICSIITLVASNEMCRIGELINNYHDGIFPSKGLWKGHDEVHTKIILLRYQKQESSKDSNFP